MNSIQKNIYRNRRVASLPPGECYSVNVYISPLDTSDATDGTVTMYYTSCGGDTSSYDSEYVFADPGTYNNATCVNVNTSFAFTYIKDGASFNASNSGFIGFGTPCGG